MKHITVSFPKIRTKMKTELSIEQSQSLISLGVSPDDASMILWKSTKTWEDKPINDTYHLVLKPFRPTIQGFESFECHDIFSLGDLFKILKQKEPILFDYTDEDSYMSFHLNYSPSLERWDVGYFAVSDKYRGCDITHHTEDELIDMLYDLICSLIKQEFIKFN